MPTEKELTTRIATARQRLEEAREERRAAAASVTQVIERAAGADGADRRECIAEFVAVEAHAELAVRVVDRLQADLDTARLALAEHRVTAAAEAAEAARANVHELAAAATALEARVRTVVNRGQDEITALPRGPERDEAFAKLRGEAAEARARAVAAQQAADREGAAARRARHDLEDLRDEIEERDAPASADRRPALLPRP